jgi:DNA repair exonuclease SbcCD ATPase subunit
MHKTSLRLFLSTMSFLFLMTAAPNALSQTPKPSDPAVGDSAQVLRELIVEVRQLRLTLQRTNINAFRAQLAIERLKVQEARVERLTNQLEENQNDLSSVKTSRTQVLGQIKDVETQLKTENDAVKKEQQETALKEFRRSLEQQNERETSLNEQRNSLMAQLQAEQTKLDELSNTLAGIQSDLEKMVRETMNKESGPKQ